jgi:integrase
MPPPPSGTLEHGHLRKGPGGELPPLTFHGLRHSAVSLMLASGADIAVVSKLMGHASIAITADVYSHLVGTIAQKAVDGAANLLHTQCTHNRGWTPDVGFVLSG